MTPPIKTRPSRPRPALVAGVLGVLFLASAVLMIVSGVQRGRMASDQLLYHEIVVRTFVRDFPSVDLGDYRSATTPGYHLAIAAVAKVAGTQRATLQTLGSLFTLALLVTLGWSLGARAPPIIAIALGLPMLASLYVWPAGVWLLPDNAGWLGVLIVLLIALKPQLRRRDLVLATIVLTILVFVRQIHLWPVAALWTAAWLGADDADDPRAGPLDRIEPIAELRALFDQPLLRARRLAPSLLVAVPAVVVIALFVRLWGGLTPPSFQGSTVGKVAHTGINPATPAFVLTLVGLLSLPFLGFWLDAGLRLMRTSRRWLIAAAVGGAVVAIIPATNWSKGDGRWTGVVWEFVEFAPTLAGRTSPIIVLGAALGCVVLLCWCAALRRRDRWIIMGALVAFIAAQTASLQLWQRYCEPLVLMLVTLMAVRAHTTQLPGQIGMGISILRWLGPAALGALFALGTAVSIAKSPPASAEQLAAPARAVEVSPVSTDP